MNKFIVTLFLGFLFTFPSLGYGSEYSKNLLVIVTTDDPVTQLMAMVLVYPNNEKRSGRKYSSLW